MSSGLGRHAHTALPPTGSAPETPSQDPGDSELLGAVLPSQALLPRVHQKLRVPSPGPRDGGCRCQVSQPSAKPHHNQVHFHDSFPHKQVSKSKHTRWALSGKTQKNLIFGPEAVDCGGNSAAKTINLCRVPQLARVVKKIIPQQNQ